MAEYGPLFWRRPGEDWHFCKNCTRWPGDEPDVETVRGLTEVPVEEVCRECRQKSGDRFCHKDEKYPPGPPPVPEPNPKDKWFRGVPPWERRPD